MKEKREKLTLSITETAKEIGVAPAKIRAKIENGEIGVILFDEKERIARVEIERFLKDSTVYV